MFSVDFETSCLTHDLSGCACDVLDASIESNDDSDDEDESELEGIDGVKKSKNEKDQWKHIHPADLMNGLVQDELIRSVQDDVSFVYLKAVTKAIVLKE